MIKELTSLPVQFVAQLIERGYEGLWILDREARTIYVNSRLAELLGYEASQMIGRMADEFMEQDVSAAWRKRWGARKFGHREDYDCRMLKADGSPAWMRVSAIPIFDSSGDWIGGGALLRDLHSLREAAAKEEALRLAKIDLEQAVRERTQELSQSRAFLDTLVENIPDTVFVKDAKTGKICPVQPCRRGVARTPATRVDRKIGPRVVSEEPGGLFSRHRSEGFG